MIGGVLGATAEGAAGWSQRAGPVAAGVPLMPGVVVFDFDPVGTILGFAVRWQIAAVAVTIVLALLLAAAIALVADRRRAEALAADPERVTAVAEAVEAALRTVRASGAQGGISAESGAVDGHGATDRPPAAPGDGPSIVDRPWLVSLRLDDLLFIAIAGAAGAVVGGRLGYALLYFDVYRLDPSSILDPSRGSLALAGGVALGVVTALAVATILGAPVRRWLGVAVFPLLLALCLGKLAMILGGTGQGLPAAAGWATAYAGPGPWGSLAPEIPSVPAQVLEAATSAAALAVVLLLVIVAPVRRRPAVLFAAGLGLWAIGRFVVAFTWRDPALVGPLNGDQLVTLGIAMVASVSLVVAATAISRARADAGPATRAVPVAAVAAIAPSEPAGPGGATLDGAGEPSATGAAGAATAGAVAARIAASMTADDGPVAETGEPPPQAGDPGGTTTSPADRPAPEEPSPPSDSATAWPGDAPWRAGSGGGYRHSGD